MFEVSNLALPSTGPPAFMELGCTEVLASAAVLLRLALCMQPAATLPPRQFISVVAPAQNTMCDFVQASS